MNELQIRYSQLVDEHKTLKISYQELIGNNIKLELECQKLKDRIKELESRKRKPDAASDS